MSTEVYEYLGQIFEWDDAKARKNWQDHGVLFTEAATVFFDKDVIFYEDEVHSNEENRYVAVGHSLRARELFVVHVYRGERVRLISAREATPRERNEYESQLGR